ncbi:Nrap protein [Amylostereum chailletii]|nr:Nrap protein [Amylostereum chailletii]
MALNLKRKRGKAGEDGTPKRRQHSLEENGILSEGEQPEQEYPDADMEGGSDVHEGSEPGGVDADVDAEEEEWGGLSTGVSPRRIGKPKKPPTGEEVRAIKEATDLFRSSSFKLQIDALLPNVRPKESRRAALDRFLLSLHACLSSAPSIPPEHPLQAARNLQEGALVQGKAKSKSDKGKAKVLTISPIVVPYPLPRPTDDSNWKVAFEKPSDITLVGSWANKVSVKAKDDEPWWVDVAVEMPSELFQEKDYMNGRFFHKRAFYLAVIARHVQNGHNGLDVDALYESRGGDPRLTTLILRPKNDVGISKLNAQIRIIPTLPSPSPVSLSKLSPRRGNLRLHSQASSASDQAENLPTPLYNSALLLAATPKAHLLSTHALKLDFPAYSDALALLRIWANQRGYGEGKTACVHGFDGRGAWWAALLELLVLGEEQSGNIAPKRKPLGKGLSSYQLFRAALDFLARHDFASGSLFVKSKEGHRFLPAEYAQHHEATLVDASSTVNVLAGIPLSSLQLLGHDARATLDILNATKVSGEPFHEVFLKDQRSLAPRFDAVIRINLTDAKMRHPSIHETVEFGSPANALLAALSSNLKKALGHRTQSFALLHPSPQARPLSQAHPSAPAEIFVGLIYNPTHAWSLVDHGSSAKESDPQAVEDFYELWGDKAELRRFQDGTIAHSVVWEVKDADERARVPIMVVKHILSRHFGISGDAVRDWHTEFDSTIRLPPSISSLHTAAGHPAGFRSAMSAFDKLVKDIKGLDEELPLSVLTVSPVSEYLRYTSVFNPVALPRTSVSSFHTSARFTPIMEALLEFEKSARWPDDLRAIQKMKLAFLERIAEALMTFSSGLSARIVVGDAPIDSGIKDEARLEIITAEGWAFGLRIWHDREGTLLDRILAEAAQVPKALMKDAYTPGKCKERDDAQEARESYTRRFVHSPRHHRAVAALSHRFSAFSGTVRLVKRWLACHWILRTHLSEEAAEIICASVFLRGTSSQPSADLGAAIPGSKERGFACVIELLKDWKWASGLHVPLYGEDAGAIPSTSTAPAWSKGVWALSTELDPTGKMWTSDGPDLVVAQRIRALAKATWDCLKGMETGILDVKALFVHPTDDYDFVVQLDPSVLPRFFQNIVADPLVWARKSKYANMIQDSEDAELRPGFDPAHAFVDDLKRVYADTVRIFYDPLGGDRVGAVWDPSLKEPRPFRVLNRFSSAPLLKDNDKAKDKGLVTLNEQAVLDEIVRMGSGLVKISVQT